ncbi:hypothetical protein ABTX82_39145 [Streptomyces lavendulae]|uniref:hypothetical protein n=1 Tax=Streptomyces lavendulae TaxID=1914 RepID=UPI003317CA1D
MEQRCAMARRRLRRGLTVRLLVDKKAARDSRAYASLQGLCRDGAQVRLADRTPGNLLICDRRQATVFHSDAATNGSASPTAPKPLSSRSATDGDLPLSRVRGRVAISGRGEGPPLR